MLIVHSIGCCHLRLVARRELVGIDLDRTGPGLATISSVEASASTLKGKSLSESLIGGAEGDGHVVPSFEVLASDLLTSQRKLTVAINGTTGVLVALVAGVEVLREPASVLRVLA